MVVLFLHVYTHDNVKLETHFKKQKAVFLKPLMWLGWQVNHTGSELYTDVTQLAEFSSLVHKVSQFDEQLKHN